MNSINGTEAALMLVQLEIETAIKKLEREITEAEAAINKVEAAVEKVEAAIEEVEAAFKEVEVNLSKVEAELGSPSLTADEKALLTEKRKLLLTKRRELLTEKRELRAKEQQLRAEKQQLRAKEQQLRAEKQQLRKKEEMQREQLKLPGSEAYVKRARTLDAPSKTSLRREQLDITGPLVINWRPTMEVAGGLLPELIHPVFAKVLEFVVGDMQLDQASVDIAAMLCCIGADIYVNEAGLTKAIRVLLEPYLGDEKAVTIDSGFAANKVSPDWALGDSPKDPSNLFLIVEAKPGIGGSGDPHFQGANYLLHFWRQRTESNVFRNTCCPAFLLEVVGPHVRLSAVAWLDRVTIFPLTPLLNLLPAHPVTDCLLMPVARMLAALRMGLRELAVADAAAVHTMAARVVEQPAVANMRLSLPWPISMNSRYDAAVARRLAPHNPTYHVRLAGSTDGEGSGGGGGVEAVVVKLCRKYGLAAHQAWAGLGLAPQVLREESLPGGWQLIEMEWLSGPEWQLLSKLLPEELSEALGAVKEALEFAHSKTGMVHGDVRPPNCLVRRVAKGAGLWEVRFVDFEWAGHEGEATYPACLNPDIPWPEGVGYGKQLQRAHDLKLLAASTAGHAAGAGRWAAGPGAVRSLHIAARDRCAMPLRKATGIMLHRGVGVGWQQRAVAGCLWPAAPGRRLGW